MINLESPESIQKDLRDMGIELTLVEAFSFRDAVLNLWNLPGFATKSDATRAIVKLLQSSKPMILPRGIPIVDPFKPDGHNPQC